MTRRFHNPAGGHALVLALPVLALLLAPKVGALGSSAPARPLVTNGGRHGGSATPAPSETADHDALGTSPPEPPSVSRSPLPGASASAATVVGHGEPGAVPARVRQQIRGVRGVHVFPGRGSGTAFPSPNRTARLPFLLAQRSTATTGNTSSPRLAAIVQPGGRETYAARLAAIRALAAGRPLSTSEATELVRFLRTTPEASGLKGNLLNHVKNDVANVLTAQTPPVPGLAENLAGMFRDKGLDQTWRDYCIQFLGRLYPQLGQEDRRTALAAFEEAAGNSSLPTAGTALICLRNNLAQPDVNRARLSEMALAIARNADVSPGARATAFGICAQLKVTEVVPTARNVAADGKSAIVRMSALSALGILGDGKDRELLNRFARHPDTRLRKAAAAARRKLKRREDGGI